MSLCHTVVVGKYIHTYRPSILIVAKVMRRSVYKRPPFRTVLNSSFPQPLILLFTTVVHKKDSLFYLNIYLLFSANSSETDKLQLLPTFFKFSSPI